MKLDDASSEGAIRKAHLTLDTFSPVNQNGSFEFDRVIKSGQVLKRNKRTKVNLPDKRSPSSMLLTKNSHGSQSSSSCDPIPSASTKIHPKAPNCAINSSSPTLPQSHAKKIPSAKQSTSSVSSLLRETSTLKHLARRKPQNGSS